MMRTGPARLVAALAAATLSWSAAAADLRVLTLDYAPYSYGEGGKPRGMNVEIAQEISKRINKPFNIEIVPWARVLEECKLGNADLVFNAVKKPEREEFAVFPAVPISIEEIVLIAPAGKVPAFNGDVASLKGMKIGVIRDFSLGKKLDDAFASGAITKDEGNNSEVLSSKLLGGRVPLIANDRVTILNHLKKVNALDKIKVLSPVVESTPTYIVACKRGKAANVAPEIDKALQQMQSDGTYKKIADKYTGS